MMWAVFAIGASILWAGANILDSYLLRNKFRDEKIFLAVDAPIIFIAGVAILLAVQETLTLQTHIALLGAGVIYGLTAVFYLKAIAIQEASRVIPLFQVSAVLLLIFGAIFFQELFSPWVYVGAFAVILGSVILSSDNLNIHNYKLHKSFSFMLSAAILFTVNQMVIKYLISDISIWHIFGWNLIGTSIVGFYYLLGHFQHVKKIFLSRTKYIILLEIFDSGAVLLLFFALSVGPVGLVTVFSSINPIFVLLIAVILSRTGLTFYKEAVDRKTLSIKIVSLILVIGGSTLALLLS